MKRVAIGLLVFILMVVNFAFAEAKDTASLIPNGYLGINVELSSDEDFWRLYNASSLYQYWLCRAAFELSAYGELSYSTQYNLVNSFDFLAIETLGKENYESQLKAQGGRDNVCHSFSIWAGTNLWIGMTKYAMNIEIESDMPAWENGYILSSTIGQWCTYNNELNEIFCHLSKYCNAL